MQILSCVHSTARLAMLAVLLLAAQRATLAADVIVRVTSPAGLGSNDTVLWGQLGSNATQIPNSFAATSGKSKSVHGTFANTTGIVVKVGTGSDWSPASGANATNDMLVWAFNNVTNSGSGAITLTLPANFGVGAAIQSDVPGAFTAKLEVFNGATSLGSVTASSNASGDALFIGAVDQTGPNINKAVFSLTAAQSNSNTLNNLQDFAIGTLHLQLPAPPTINSSPPPDGFVGLPYSFNYTGTGAPSFSVTSGALPPGLSLSSSGGLSGTPTTDGTFTGVVTATNGTAPDATQPFSIKITIPPSITSAPPPDGSVGVSYSFTYTISGQGTFTFAVSNGMLPTGLSLSPAGVISGTPTLAGTYSGVVTASDGSPPDVTQAFSITITMIPPVFTSPPTANPNPAFIGQSVSFSGGVKGTAPLKFSWDFGDGSSATTLNATHTYSAPGTYTATLTATDTQKGTVSGSVAVVVNAPFIGTGLDSNGDGISDSLNQTLGVNPSDPSTAPLSNPGAPPMPLKISKMQVKLNFSNQDSDAIAISGTLPISANAKLGGQKFVVQIGTALSVLALNAKGQGSSDTALFKIQVKAKKGVVAAQNAKFALKLGHATFAKDLASAGLTNANVSKKVTVAVAMIFEKTLFQKSQPLKYVAKADKSGVAK
jgi:PKD repeat protein